MSMYFLCGVKAVEAFRFYKSIVGNLGKNILFLIPPFLFTVISNHAKNKAQNVTEKTSVKCSKNHPVMCARGEGNGRVQYECKIRNALE